MFKQKKNAKTQRKTPKMSTYLVFFAVGRFVFTHDAKDQRVRAATLPGMKKFVRNFYIEILCVQAKLNPEISS